MKPVGITSFEGPSIYAGHPVVRLNIEPDSMPRLPAAELRRRAGERLPGGESWHRIRSCLADLADRDESVDPGALLAELTRAIQPRPFGPPFPNWQEPSRYPGKTEVLVGIADPDIGEGAALLACQIAQQLLRDADAESVAAERDVLAAELKDFRRRCPAMGYNESYCVLLDAARERGVPVRKLVRGQRVALLGHGVRSLRLGQAAGDRTSGFASLSSNDKSLTSRILSQAGIPVPRQYLIESERDIAAAIADIGFPLVVKGRTGSKGQSVTANIRSRDAIETALAKAKRYSNQQVIEQHVEGTDYRLLVVDGKMVAAARRRAAHVIGDGRSSVLELIAGENRRRESQGPYAHWLVPLTIDADSRGVLAQQSLTPESVPEDGREVRLRSAGNISQGGLPEDVTDEVHPGTVALALRAARVIGLDIAGVDVFTSDITRPLAETGGVILEINHFPNLRPHYATKTPPRDAAGAIVDYLFPAPERGCIPLAAVTGTNGKTTTCRLLHRALMSAGYCAGLVTTTSSLAGEEIIFKGDYANTVGAHAVLQDRRVEVAVLETSRGGMIRKGLGWDRCSVAVITNISEDHLGQDAIETVEGVAKIKGLILELAQDAVVLNADDAYCRAMAERASAPIWWVSALPPSPLLKEHLERGGNAVVLEGDEGDERIVYRSGGQQSDIIAARDMPATLDGMARHNVENALTASAAALAMGAPPDALRKALSSFTLSYADSSRRFNIHDVDGARIVLDYAHNMAGIASMGETLSKMPVTGRRLCQLLTWGRRRDDFFAKFAASAAPYFDGFVVTEAFRKTNPRPTGEAARLLADGLIEAGVSPNDVIVEADERKAVDRALALVRPGDLLMIVPDKYEEAWEKVLALRLTDVSKDTSEAEAAAQ